MTAAVLHPLSPWLHGKLWFTTWKGHIARHLQQLLNVGAQRRGPGAEERAAGLLQVQDPTRQHSPSWNEALWPLSAAGQGGQEAGTVSAPTGQGCIGASLHHLMTRVTTLFLNIYIQQVANGKQALTDACSWAKHVAKTEAHSFLRDRRCRAKATTAHYFWEKLLPGSPAG